MRWLFLLPLWVWGSARSEQGIVHGPQETFVNIGKTVVLRCKVENQRGAVQWMKNGFGLGVDRQLKFFPRYSMVGSASKGEYNLQIVNVTVTDDDVYACQISEAANEPAVVSSPAKLTVLMRPSHPKLYKPAGHLITAIAEETLIQSCVSRKGKPPPRLGWVISSDPEGKHILTWLGETRAKFGHLNKSTGMSQASLAADVIEEIQKEGQVYSVSSNLTFVPRAEDDRRYIVCLSQHETFPEKMETDSVKMSLQYAPRVNLTVASGGLREGAAALLACDVDAKPLDNVRIAWFKNSNEPLSQTTDTLSFDALRMEDHRAEFACEATNVIGTRRSTIKLDVEFGARIMSTPQDKEVNEGDTVSFRCEALGNPSPMITWTRAGDDQIIAKGEMLTIENVRTWQQGEYLCTAIVQGFPQDVMSNYLHIRGSPIVSMAEEITGTEGETAEISCEISGRPKPPDVKWTKDGNEINYASGRMQVHQIPRPYGLESRLTIRDMMEHDYGLYNCTANNGLGQDSRGSYLRPKGVIDVLASLDSQTIVPLIAGFLMLVFCICCCTFCRRRRYSKKKGTKFIDITDDQSDVTVKCEALDGQYFPDMYSSPLENGNIITTKDYISIPQNNPDLDYMGTGSTFSNNLYPKYMNPSMDYNVRFEPSYGSFASGISTPAGMSDVYGVGEKPTILETLPEVDTPRTSSYNFISTPEHARPISRTSTHV